MSQVATRSDSVTSIPADPMVAVIERALRDPDIDVGKLEHLLRLHHEVRHEEARRSFNENMALAQSEMERVGRGAVNTHTRSKYATLEAIDEKIKPVYTKHGFSIRFGSAAAAQAGWVRITATLAHRDGHVEEYHLDSPLDSVGSQGKVNKTPVQAVGSTVSYLRRYLTVMMFNVALVGEDDDGVGAGRQEEIRDTRSQPSSGPLRAYAATVEAAKTRTPPIVDDDIPDLTPQEPWSAESLQRLRDNVDKAIQLCAAATNLSKLDSYKFGALMEDCENAGEHALKELLVREIERHRERLAAKETQQS